MIIEVSNDELGSRLDKFLKRKIKVLTQSFIEKVLEKGISRSIVKKLNLMLN